MGRLYKNVIIIAIIAIMLFAMVGCGANSSYMKNDSNYEVDGYSTEEKFNTEEYNYIQENNYKSVADYPVSTFSADVDTASYSNVRRIINEGKVIDKGAVRVEEMINYFKYDYPNPKADEPFSITTELSECPWNKDSKLMLIGLKTEDIDFSKSPDSNLVFLLDVSGSMNSYDKLPLMTKSFKMLTANLTEKDKVSIVTYASDERIVIEGVSGDNPEIINEALDALTAGGSTHGSKGIVTAYELAEKYFIKGGNNRVILATDGDLNVGLTSESELEKLITEKKNSGVFLSVLGFGTGNIKDNKMETLADKGNGNYSYIDSLYEAKKVLVDEMGATLVTVAKDVKLQVEFNPANVKGYRLVGYENRLLAAEDFNDDKKDAGEMGAGHSVTALYEIVLNDSKMEIPSTKLKYQSNENTNNTDELLTINIRYKKPDSDVSELVSKVVTKSEYKEQLPKNLKFASAVAEFGMILRESKYIENISYGNVLELLDEETINSDKYRLELVELVKKAAEIYGVETRAKEASTSVRKDYTEEEKIIINAFEEAERAYAWFTSYSEINGAGEESAIEIDEDKYYKVDFKNIKSIDDLKNYLRDYFDEKMINELFDIKLNYGDKEYNLFIENDENLYYFGGYVGQLGIDSVDKKFSKITKDSENKYTLTMDMIWKGFYGESPYKYVSYDYTYEKIGDKWIFTNFVLPIKYCIENGVERPDSLIAEKSPDNKYSFTLAKESGALTVYKGDNILLGYFLDKSMPWDEEIVELKDFWWDLEFNKLFVLVGPNINKVVDIYCVDLAKEDILNYGTVGYHPENINKKSSYIYYTDAPHHFDVDSDNEDWYLNKKYSAYLYNLRTNERFLIKDFDNYSVKKLDDTSIVYTQEYDSKKPSDVTVDISPYVDKNRNKDAIKAAVIKAHNNNLSNYAAGLSEIFITKQGNYQIVKITRLNNSHYYELWKLDKNKYERVLENIDNMFLTNSQKYLCTVNKNGEFKVYNDSFECIIDKNIYSVILLSNYKLDSLDIGEHYIMNFDEHIFLTVKSNDMLVDVVDVNIEANEIKTLPYKIDCHYDNHFINPYNGYMIYQTGSSVIGYNGNKKYLESYGEPRLLMAINLLNMEQRNIDSDNCLFTFYIQSEKDSLTYNKYIKNEMSTATLKTYNFDNKFIGE